MNIAERRRKQLEAYKLNLVHFKSSYNEFVRIKVAELANKHLVDPIIWEMEQQGFSKKIWQNTILDEVNLTPTQIKLTIRSEYFSETGFDVAVAREYGTKTHFIKPRVKLALSWIGNGKRLFSKGHWVSGIKSLRIIHTTVESNKDQFAQAFNEEFERWRTSIFGDNAFDDWDQLHDLLE